MSKSVMGAGAVRSPSFVSFRKTPVALAIGFAVLGAQVGVAAEAADESEELAEVTVTGSRIQQAVGMSTPTPVASLSIAELQAMAPASITEALTQLPQFYNSATAETFGQSGGGFFVTPGGGSLNLRGIGTKRTLTLLDGRRMVSATANGGPDINMFPDQMLKRVEAVTGGASAAYGTDAVSGVVNYILDTEFEGFRASAQTGFSDRKDGENNKFSVAVGHALSDKMHLLFSAGYSNQKEIIGYEGRDWYQGCGLMQNNVPANVNGTTGANNVAGNGGFSIATPRVVPGCNLHNTGITYDGLFTIAGRTYEFQSDGRVIPFQNTRPAAGAAASSAVQVGGGGQNMALTDTTVLPSSSRKNVFTYLDYDVTDNLNVYVQGMYGQQTLRTFGRVGDFNTGPPQAITIFRNNAYLPASVAAIMDANAVTSLSMTRAGTREDWGSGSFANSNRTRVATMGFKSTIGGGFLEGWNVDGYAQYGKNELDAAQEGGVRLDRIYLATDAVVDPVSGAIRCNVTLTSGYAPDCVPLNVFGRGNASPGAVDWIKGFDPGVSVTTSPFIGYGPNNTPIYGDPYSYVGDADKHRLLTLTQKVFEVSASGKVVEGWAGPITAALGAHYREEGIDQKVQASQGNPAADPTYYPVWCPDNVVTTNARCVSQVARGIRPAGAIGVRGVPGNPYQNSVEIQFSNVPFIAGSFNVKEVFTETIVPLVADQPWMKDMNFQGAVRWADYAGSGSIWSYKLGLNATVTDEIRLRGTYSHDTRAANIAERFDRTGGFTAGLTDRISPLPTGWTQGTAVTRVRGGNPNVEPETATTFTVGVVYQPNWLPGLDLSVDWLKVSLKDAIELIDAQRVIDLCYQGNDQDQCAKITRDPSNNQILFIPELFENLSKATFEGVDVDMFYSHGVNLFGGNERLGLRLSGSVLLENSTTNSQGVKTDSTGSVVQQLFKKKANASLTYSNGPFRWNLQARYLGGGKLSTLYNTPKPAVGTNPGLGGAVLWDVADNTIGSTIHWDTRVGYDISVGGGHDLELFANVQNLFDRDPPMVLLENSSAQVAGGYDQLGRRYVVGMNLRF
jgi:iron complex outermembrane recepter protein